MKKVLAVVLALVMALSCTTVAFAFEISEGIVYLGFKENIKANPGESTTLTVEFKALPTADIVEAVDPAGTLTVAFGIYGLNPSDAPLAGLELTEQAKKEGVEITVDPDWDISDEATITATVSFPAKFVVNKETLDLFTVKVNVDPAWPVKDYHEEYALGFQMLVGEVKSGMPAMVTNPDESIVEIWGIMSESASITAKPYQPTFFERVWEWIKDKIRFLIDIDNTINTLLLTEVFTAADWYSEYRDAKDAEKKAKQEAKEAKKAEKEAAQVAG